MFSIHETTLADAINTRRCCEVVAEYRDTGGSKRPAACYFGHEYQRILDSRAGYMFHFPGKILSSDAVSH
jgi:hypothetical protein